MSGSIGGSRIPTKSVKPTVDNYIDKVLKGFKGYKECDTTGSYNVIMKLGQEKKEGHGDIDLVVHIESDDLKKTKKDFKNYLDSLPDDITPKFVFGNHKGDKSQLYGAIVTCGFPIYGDESKYVQIDNVIVTTKNDMKYQKTFLDLNAQKQALIQGLVRVILQYENKDEIWKHFQLAGLPEPEKNQEYEFVCSPTGLSLRLVTLTEERKEDTKKRVELWRSNNWDDVNWLLRNYDVEGSAEECLDKVEKRIKDKRSRERIVGVVKSMIRVGPGEVGTPKGNAKQEFIDLCQSKLLTEHKMMSLKEYITESEVISINEKLSFGDKIDYFIFTKIFKQDWVTQEQYIKRVKKVVEENSDNKVSIILKKYKDIKKDLSNCLNKDEELSSHDWGTFSIEKGIKEAHWWNDIKLEDDFPFLCYYNRSNKDKYVLEPDSLWFLKQKNAKGNRELMGGLSLDTEDERSFGWLIKNYRIPQALDYAKWEEERNKKDEEFKKKEQESIKASIKRMEDELVKLKELVKNKE